MSKIRNFLKAVTCRDLSAQLVEVKRLDEEAKEKLLATPKEKLKEAIQKQRDSLVSVASVLLALALLPGCSALGLSTSTLDAQAVAQNLKNVEAITAENGAYLASDPKAESLKAAQRDRNAAALTLAQKMAESAR